MKKDVKIIFLMLFFHRIRINGNFNYNSYKSTINFVLTVYKEWELNLVLHFKRIVQMSRNQESYWMYKSFPFYLVPICSQRTVHLNDAQPI